MAGDDVGDVLGDQPEVLAAPMGDLVAGTRQEFHAQGEAAGILEASIRGDGDIVRTVVDYHIAEGSAAALIGALGSITVQALGLPPCPVDAYIDALRACVDLVEVADDVSGSR